MEFDAHTPRSQMPEAFDQSALPRPERPGPKRAWNPPLVRDLPKLTALTLASTIGGGGGTGGGGSTVFVILITAAGLVF